jgi:mediator of RNA polymerase II transcription subunit 7
MEDDETELQNPFPSPPSHYVKYTAHNLKLLSLLRERSGNSAADADQRQVLSDQSDVPDWQLIQLEKPRVDWILDEPEAYYNVFGDTWFVRPLIYNVFIGPSFIHLGQR